MEIDGLNMNGKYSFLYVEHAIIRNSNLNTKDAFWHSKNVTVEDCTMEQTDLSFENSEVHAVISGQIDSVKNPICGEIYADAIGELILETGQIDPSRTKIVCGNK